MNAPAPIIFIRGVEQPLLSPLARALSALISLGSLSVLIVANILTPNQDGVGTHRGMGLRECQFLERTGLPCPSCGMTTSFSWFAHGNVVASFYVQPMGMVLAILTVAVFWTALYIAMTGKPVHRLLSTVRAGYLIMPLLGFAVLAWAWKIFIHLRGIDGW